MRKSLPPIAPPELQFSPRRPANPISYSLGFPAEFLLFGAAFLVLILG